MRRTLVVGLLLLGLGPGVLLGQPLAPEPTPLFDDTVVPRLDVTLDPADLALILAPGNEQSDVEYPATFAFDNGTEQFTVENVGFRLRGNTSRFSQKQSFKVSFNTFTPGGDLFGIEKLNLNGEHNDPSIIRAKLSWDLFQTMGLPAPRANHVRLYVNGDYRGLYINVEHIDEEFTDSRFGTDGGSLYKCLYPADLTYRGPEASAYWPDDERRPYDYKSGPDEEGYADLAHFIDVLNNTPDPSFPEAIEAVFDVNGFLRALAIDVVTGSWDDYWYLQNNYYLFYHPAWDRFVYLPYDFDNTFGIDWVGPDWGTRDVYAWGHHDEPRPLTDRLLAVDDFRDRFTFYLRRTLEQAFSPDRLNPRIDALLAQIRDAAAADDFRTRDYGYTFDDFLASYTQPLGGHVEYGLKPFISQRYTSALGQLDDVNVPPIFSYLQHTPQRPQTTSDLTVTVLIEDEDRAAVTPVLSYRISGQASQQIPLHDDGQHGDGAAGDGLYGARIPAPNHSANLFYFVRATDGSGQERQSAIQTVSIGYTAPALVINEFMARNASTITDESGAYPDWVELYNAGTEPVSMSGLYLTDDFARPDRWAFPDTTIQPGGFLLIWADDDQEDGPLHTTFQLGGDGEEIGLFFQDGGAFAAIDSLRFGPQPVDVSFGRLEDGGAAMDFLPTPTPGRSNQSGGVSVEPDEAPAAVTLGAPYPNPFRTHTILPLTLDRPAEVQVEVIDVLGRRIWHAPANQLPNGPHTLTWDGTTTAGGAAPAGLYLIRLRIGPEGAPLRTQQVIRLP